MSTPNVGITNNPVLVTKGDPIRVEIRPANGGDGVQSVTGDGVDNTDPANPVLTFPTAGEIGAVATNTSGSIDITAVWGGTQAEYDLLTPSATTLYVIVG